MRTIEGIAFFDSSVDRKILNKNHFPLDVLPSVCRPFIDELSLSSGAPKNFIAISILAQASMMAKNCRLKKGAGYYEYPNLYLGMIGEPGTAKTPAIELSIASIMNRTEHEYRLYQDNLRIWNEENKTDKERKLFEADKPQQKPMCVNATGTIEGMINEMHKMFILDESPQLLAYRDELISLIGEMDQYRSGKGSDQQRWLQFYQGSTLPITLKKETVLVPKARVTLIGGIQPTVLRDKIDDAEDGFFDRFFFVIDTKGAVASKASEKLSESVFADYLNYTKYISNDKTFELSQRQEDMIQEFFNWSADTGHSNGTSAFKKWDRGLYKIIICLTVLWNNDRIMDDIVSKSITLVKFFAQQWLDVKKMREGDNVLRELIFNTIRENKKIKPSELLYKKKIKSSIDHARALLIDMEESGEIIKMAVKSKGNKPSYVYILGDNS